MYTKNSHWITLLTMVAVVGLLPFSSIACENFFTEPFGAPLTPSSPPPANEPPEVTKPPKEEPKQPTITYKKHPLELVINFNPEGEKDFSSSYRISDLLLCEVSSDEQKNIKDCGDIKDPDKKVKIPLDSLGFSQESPKKYTFVPSLALKSLEVQKLVSTPSSTNICSGGSSLFFSPLIVSSGSGPLIFTDRYNRISFEKASSGAQQACTTLHANQILANSLTLSTSGLFQLVGPENFVLLEKIVQP